MRRPVDEETGDVLSYTLAEGLEVRATSFCSA